MTLTTAIVAGAVLLLLLALARSRSTSSDSLDVDPNTATEADMRALMIAGRKIDAIKVYRRLHGVDLKTAKEAVDRMSAELPPMPRG